jgi:DNA-binding MarR family transcriptional regulator
MPVYIDFTSRSPEEAFIHTEFLIEVLDIFNEVFNKTQERVKPYLRQLLSAKYYEAAVEAQKLNKDYPFFDYKTIKTRAIGQNISTQKEIAEKWRRDESDASRTIEKFEKRVKEKIPARQTVRR